MLERAPDDSPAQPWCDPPHCRFEVAPPRNFVYPAILLLLSERPRHGYRLVDPIRALGFGPVDRPSVYRALADLERDGLLQSWDAEPTAGATRHVYAVTAAGRTVLQRWSTVLVAEREGLDRVLTRLALLDHPRLPVPCPTDPPDRPARVLRLAGASRRPKGADSVQGSDGQDDPPAASQSPTGDAVEARPPDGPLTRFEVSADRSAIMIRARSNVGTIEFGTTGVNGFVNVSLGGGGVDIAAGVVAHLEVDVRALTSGNSLYDAELMHRVHARMFPTAIVDLDDVQPLGTEDRFHILGRLTFHGVTAAIDGAVSVTLLGDNKVVVSGEKVIDIRDFEITAPTMLMLKIYPDVRVFLHLEAEANHTAGQPA